MYISIGSGLAAHFSEVVSFTTFSTDFPIRWALASDAFLPAVLAVTFLSFALTATAGAAAATAGIAAAVVASSAAAA